MKDCDAVKTQDRGRDKGRRAGQAAVGLFNCRLKGWPDALVVLFAATIFVSPAQAQQPKSLPVCSTGRELITIPEVTRKQDGKLRAVLMLSDEYRSMGGSGTGERCLWQHLRYFKGWDAAAGPPEEWPPPTSPPNPKDLQPGEPIPGPTLRARIGDLVQISFLNQIDTKNFPTSLDVGETGKTSGCDEAFGGKVEDPPEYPPGTKKPIEIYPRNDSMPNCLHGSSTANVHFHGTHTTPSTTGDNVLLYIRPALRVKGQIDPPDAKVKSAFAEFFNWCETNGSPTRWVQLPSRWQAEQKRLLQLYDKTAPYQGQPGKLPEANKLWPKNAEDIEAKPPRWPQISIGAFPYCFRLPDDKDQEDGKVKMAQAPGTHWYHAHKHGSTALNVGNGMTGAFIIEGPYDDQLRDFYKKTNPDPGLEEKVLVIQQLETSLNMLSATTSFQAAPLSVNGRRQPVMTMRPGQVQMWRIVNGAPRSFVQFVDFATVTPTLQAPTPCSNTATPCIEWRQTAQDGVQFHPDNYEKVGKVNAKFNMAAANRVDLLVKAPTTAGSYLLQVVDSVLASPPEDSTPVTLLTVNVTGTKVEPTMDFIGKKHFPNFPEFLKDIPKYEVSKQRKLVFNTTPGLGRGGGDPPGDLPRHSIDGKLFSNNVSQSMVLNAVEEWALVNKTVGIAHPFHIHINPFQVVEFFDPNSAEAATKPTDGKPNPCYADPMKPETWKPCKALEAPFVWWDNLAIPSARAPEKLNCDACPTSLGVACSFDNDKKQCTVKIPGYFKMRSRFADFPGQFVQHCHILAHEDRGMMQLIEILPKGQRVSMTKGEAIPTHD